MRAAPQIIALATIALLTLGMVMVTSAAMSLDAQAFTFRDVLESKTGVAFGLAVFALLLGAITPLRSLMRVLARAAGDEPQRFGLFLLMLAGGLLFIVAILPYLPGFGHAVNNSRRWIRVPGIASLTIQPSEIVKWGLVLVLAIALWLRRNATTQGLRPVLPLLLVAGLVIAPVVIEDLGTGVLLLAVAGVLIVAGGACWWKLAPLGLVPLAGAVALVAIEPYRMARIRTFLDPFADPQGEGYHVVQSMATIAGGDTLGRGLGMGIQKFGYLPEDQTDFVFAVVNEELGLAGAALVVFLYLAILWAGFAIMRAERQLALKLIALGVVTTIGAQAAINLLVVTGWAPAKGIPLPLLSSGGTGWIMTAGSLGLLVSIDRSRRDETIDDIEDEWEDEDFEEDEDGQDEADEDEAEEDGLDEDWDDDEPAAAQDEWEGDEADEQEQWEGDNEPSGAVEFEADEEVEDELEDEYEEDEDDAEPGANDAAEDATDEQLDEDDWEPEASLWDGLYDDDEVDDEAR